MIVAAICPACHHEPHVGQCLAPFAEAPLWTNTLGREESR